MSSTRYEATPKREKTALLITTITYVSKILVEKLDVSVYELQGQELIVKFLNGTAEVQARVSDGECKTTVLACSSIFNSRKHVDFVQ